MYYQETDPQVDRSSSKRLLRILTFQWKLILNIAQAMASITDLPYELLYHIIFLLLQSSVGAGDFARIISVCKKFSLFREDELLKLVNFDAEIELKNIYQYQHVNGLLVKCSEAGNVSACFLLGKVILVSSSQWLLRDWQKAECDVHPYDNLTLRDLEGILAINVHAQNCRVDSFMNYFLPKEVSTSGSSQTGLVHHLLVKFFLLNGSHHDLVDMSAFLKGYTLQLRSVSTTGGPLFRFVSKFLATADRVRDYENEFVNDNDVRDAAYNAFTTWRHLTLRVFDIFEI